MKIMLTGASGFTGRFFKMAAETAGHQVFELKSDLTNKVLLQNEIISKSPDAVVHLAAVSFVGHADDLAFYKVNVLGTMNLLGALSNLPIPPKRILLASSANVYGNCSLSPVCEGYPLAPVNHYAMSKLAMEYMAMTYQNKLPIILLRPFNYTGVGQSPKFLIPKLVNCFVRRTPVIELGNLEIEREFNDVRMVCSAYLHLLHKGQPGETYNVCSGLPYTLHQIISHLTEITGHKIHIQVSPEFVRPNEVHRLYGCPNKLLDCTGPLPQIELQDTLRWMLNHPHDDSC